ncbi:MAG: transketolase [Marinilabiliales bacterium]|nr:MAG: transketolase [Marinilabiliales bacterium]
MTQKNTSKSILSNKELLLNDYKLAWQSRHASIIGRKEVLSGKAKFGIFGDGKEIPQLALAHFFNKGDWRSGYYRDQTLMMALGVMTLKSFFAQLYGNTDLEISPDNGGRLMNNHFATRSLDEHGDWKNLMQQYNSSADISPTAGQMPRLVGLAMASQWYRTESNERFSEFSHNGNEIAFGTIGDASTSEGHFWESLNAAGVMQIPMAMVVWDDGYGISVNIEKQTVKASISEALAGFQRTKDKPGFEIIKVKAWDYPALLAAFEKGTKLAREKHIPVLFHVVEVTQPQGHSTSGSHERYKSEERLQWEKEFDAIAKYGEYLLSEKIATEEELKQIEEQALKDLKEAKKQSWKAYNAPFIKMRDDLVSLSNITSCHCAKTDAISKMMDDLKQVAEPGRKEVISTAKRVLRYFCQTCSPEKSLKKSVGEWLDRENKKGQELYSSHLYSETEQAALKQKEIPPQYSEQPVMVPGREIIRDNFDYILQNNPNTLAFGEDVGKIGGVNQTWEGLQDKYGEHRVFDTGIREATILGQAIGLAMRGLRPIAEVQYFDYLMYALQTISDDLATLRWRTVGGQKAPVIISTRGHRLEGVWHSGSALSMVINSIRGVHVMVPRNMTQAAGFYNTLIKSDDPGLIIEPLNAYRLREPRPENIGEFTVPLGKPEVLQEGTDVTLVTYGSCVRIAEEAIPQLAEMDISVELIDVQTLLPFDLSGTIISSLMKTNKIVFFDEDVPGGTTAYMMQQVLEKQGGWNYLDAEPKTITAKDHRPAYGSDGDYFSNPNAENVFDTVYELMNEYNPTQYPSLY